MNYTLTALYFNIAERKELQWTGDKDAIYLMYTEMFKSKSNLVKTGQDFQKKDMVCITVFENGSPFQIDIDQGPEMVRMSKDHPLYLF